MNHLDTLADARSPATITGSAFLAWVALPVQCPEWGRVVVTMAYTQSHHTCPALLACMLRLQAAVGARGEQARFVIIGCDPAQDSPPNRRRYRSGRRLARSNWHFLTTRPADVRLRARLLGFEFRIYNTHVLRDPRLVAFNRSGLPSATVTAAEDDNAALN